MNPIDPKQLDDADLIINFYDNTLCTDYRQELAKEIYRRAGVTDGTRRIQQAEKQA
ncbi:hypothetical protein HFE03_03590 [Paenibacillus sp. EKM102P]|uniref:hypothetical protein n=1 Tax=unclassified Paenibacillus TaxID=185978 RepID=UPI00142D2312|nr:MULTISPECIES: hypothetical protein [unclassified Paenibacillus]KAF6618293.1 hypothetical protein HFE00_09430 [Paenibacillus sp. EKM101P]KAF6624638.1 hypothetical protein HFE03_03590 [Paenibacillus sp. EKM102P]KAF6635583.1 hypothetical protein HFE01_01440 [Paenibacillus sp. EKM10P]KAF6648707.1 hypothetical protein HFE02_10110 [Paenibacillus sp. EKM11P]